jgi:hypothetical protein
VAFSLVLFVGLLVSAEVILQLLARSSRQVNAMLSQSSPPFTLSDRELVWRGNPDHPRLDRRGFRNAEVRDDVAIVTLGDSQTYGSNVARDQTWPHQLERLGEGATYNMAFPGWGPLQSYLVLDEALALKPEQVVAALYTGNDVVDAYTFVYHRKKLTRQFRSEEPSIRAALERAEDADPWDGTPLGDQGPEEESRPKADQRPDSLAEAVEMQSKLYGLGRAVWRAYDYYRRHPVRPEQGSANDPLKDDDYLSFRTSSFRTVLTPSYRLPAVVVSDPRVAEGTRITLEALEAMREQCVARGVGFSVLLIPTKELALSEVVREQLTTVPPLYARLADNEARLRELLTERLESQQIAVIDALPRLRELARGGVLPYSTSKDGHLNPAGQQAVAELVSGAVGPKSAPVSSAR